MRTRLAAVCAVVLSVAGCASSDSARLDEFATRAESRASGAPAHDQASAPEANRQDTGVHDLGELVEVLRVKNGLYPGLTEPEATCAAEAVVHTIDLGRAVDLVRAAQVSDADASLDESADIADAIIACSDATHFYRVTLHAVYSTNEQEADCIVENTSESTFRDLLRADYLPIDLHFEVSESLNDAVGAVGACLDGARVHDLLLENMVLSDESISGSNCFVGALIGTFGHVEALQIYVTLQALDRTQAEGYVDAVARCFDIRATFFDDWADPEDPEGLEACVSASLTIDDVTVLFVNSISDARPTESERDVVDRYLRVIDDCHDELGHTT